MYQTYKTGGSKRLDIHAIMEGIDKHSQVFESQLSFPVFDKKKSTLIVVLKFVQDLFKERNEIDVIVVN